MTDAYWLVFEPTAPAISERSLKKIIHDNLVFAGYIDEGYAIPWERYLLPLKGSKFRPLALHLGDIFCVDCEEEKSYIKKLANMFGYEVYEKTIFSPGHKYEDIGEVEEKEEETNSSSTEKEGEAEEKV